MRSASKLIASVIIFFVSLTVSFSAESFSSKEFYRSLSSRLHRNREDYPSLSDAEFANFRMVDMPCIGKGKLYRSSSPISTWGNRNVIADNLAREAGVRTFVNLADKASDVKGHKGFDGSYYSTQKIITLGLNMKYQSKEFRASLAKGITEMSESEPPYLVHCSLGKDRSGFVCALIECLMGANIDEVTVDNQISLHNYFGIEPGSEEYEFMATNEIQSFLARDFGVKREDLWRINLADAGERYFRSIGVSAEAIEALREKLKP